MMRGLVIVIGLLGVAMPDVVLASGPSLQDRQQAACYDDVMRLCSEAVPDVDRVTACMSSKRALVSAPCAAFYPKGKK